jgi:hypothetical protein
MTIIDEALRVYTSTESNDAGVMMRAAIAAALIPSRSLFESRLAVIRSTAHGDGDFPFGMDDDQGSIYLSGKADALQWVLEMLPSIETN